MDRGSDPTERRDLERERAESARRLELVEAVERDAFRWVMSNERGRRFVRLLLERARVSERLEAPNDRAMAHAVGYRNFGCDLDRDLERHCPELRLQMHKEKLSGDADGRTKAS